MTLRREMRESRRLALEAEYDDIREREARRNE